VANLKLHFDLADPTLQPGPNLRQEIVLSSWVNIGRRRNLILILRWDENYFRDTHPTVSRYEEPMATPFIDSLSDQKGKECDKLLSLTIVISKKEIPCRLDPPTFLANTRKNCEPLDPPRSTGQEFKRLRSHMRIMKCASENTRIYSP